MDVVRAFNILEVVLWLAFAGAAAGAGSVRGMTSRLRCGFTLGFLSFALSDIWEAFTGAWWRPWPLFVLKGACLVTLLTCGILLAASRRKTGWSEGSNSRPKSRSSSGLDL